MNENFAKLEQKKSAIATRIRALQRTNRGTAKPHLQVLAGAFSFTFDGFLPFRSGLIALPQCVKAGKSIKSYCCNQFVAILCYNEVVLARSLSRGASPDKNEGRVEIV